jgi:prepilin-type N-terminal cleavage/methylation domain-containing protein|tara:strand:+ start:52 stop:660 length:609 start_codon:yes stop_codon:yes gene_type:complete
MLMITSKNKNRSLGKDSQRGFTIIELIIVVTVLGILIPITATLVINSYSYYSNILNMNKLSLSADNALRSITNDIRLMEGFQSADDDDLYFTLADGEVRYYRFDSETFQMCKESCFADGNPVPENFGVLATNVNVDESSFKYYTELNEDDPLILGDNDIDLRDQDFGDPMDSPVIFIKVEFQLDWDNMELPFMTIVRPGIPS